MHWHHRSRPRPGAQPSGERAAPEDPRWPALHKCFSGESNMATRVLSPRTLVRWESRDSELAQAPDPLGCLKTLAVVCPHALVQIARLFHMIIHPVGLPLHFALDVFTRTEHGGKGARRGSQQTERLDAAKNMLSLCYNKKGTNILQYELSCFNQPMKI